MGGNSAKPPLTLFFHGFGLVQHPGGRQLLGR